MIEKSDQSEKQDFPRWNQLLENYKLQRQGEQKHDGSRRGRQKKRGEKS